MSDHRRTLLWLLCKEPSAPARVRAEDCFAEQLLTDLMVDIKQNLAGLFKITRHALDEGEPLEQVIPRVFEETVQSLGKDQSDAEAAVAAAAHAYVRLTSSTVHSVTGRGAPRLSTSSSPATHVQGTGAAGSSGPSSCAAAATVTSAAHKATARAAAAKAGHTMAAGGKGGGAAAESGNSMAAVAMPAAADAPLSTKKRGRGSRSTPKKPSIPKRPAASRAGSELRRFRKNCDRCLGMKVRKSSVGVVPPVDVVVLVSGVR